MVKTVNAIGKKCPLPIILTKKCINESQIGDTIEVLLDNDISKCNLIQYLKEINIECKEQLNEDYFKITIELSAPIESKLKGTISCPITNITAKSIEDYIIVIKSDKMGEGGNDLGETLMRSYINVLPQLESLPKMIVFYNSGVNLIDNGIDTLDALRELEQCGVEIISCGICVDYYNISVSVGTISNMYKIGNSIANTLKVIYP